MIYRYSVDMTLAETDACVADFIGRVGLGHVLRVAIDAARTNAGKRMSEAEKDFELLGRIAEAAGLEKEGDDDREA